MAQRSIRELLEEVIARLDDQEQNQAAAGRRDAVGGTANRGGTGGRLDGTVRAVARDNVQNQVIATPRAGGMGISKTPRNNVQSQAAVGGTANRGGTGGRLDGTVRAVARDEKKTQGSKTAKKAMTMEEARKKFMELLMNTER